MYFDFEFLVLAELVVETELELVDLFLHLFLVVELFVSVSGLFEELPFELGLVESGTGTDEVDLDDAVLVGQGSPGPLGLAGVEVF